MSSFCIPERFTRVVVVGGATRSGALHGVTLALSPLVHPDQEIVLVDSITAPGLPAAHTPTAAAADAAAAATATLTAAKAALAQSRTSAGGDGLHATPPPPRPTAATAFPIQCYNGRQHPSTPFEVSKLVSRVRLHSPEAGPLAVNTATDLLLCVLDGGDPLLREGTTARHAHIVGQITSAVVSAAAAGSGASTAPAVVAVTDDASRHALLPLCRAVCEPCITAAGKVPCLLAIARTRVLSPPALEYGLTKVALLPQGGAAGLPVGDGALATMLPALCTGVLLGAVSELPVQRSDAVPFVPIDVALNAALGHAVRVIRATAAAAAATTTAAAPKPRPSAVMALHPAAPTDTMVWGMFGNYVADYYGRYAKAISQAFPVKGIVGAAPGLNFLFNTADVVNYGVEATDVTRAADARRAAGQRKHLLEVAPRDWDITRLLALLDAVVAQAAECRITAAAATQSSGGGAAAAQKSGSGIDGTGLPAHLRKGVPGLYAAAAAAVSYAVSPTAPSHQAQQQQQQQHTISGLMDAPNAEAHLSLPMTPVARYNSAYRDLLAAFSAHTDAFPLLQYVSLADLDWGMYVRYTACLVLLALARRCGDGAGASAAASSADFPFPTREFVNDVIYNEALQAPPSPIAARRVLGVGDWYFRTGMGANGVRGAMTPGFTPQRMEAMLSQPHIVQVIEAVAEDQKLPKDKVLKQARKILTRIGDTMNHIQCRAMGTLVSWMFNKVYDRVCINPGAVEYIHRINTLPRTCVVYMPMHRSYSDFLIMTYLLAIMGQRPPHIVSGEDFLRLGKFSELMRGSGAFFMRRTFRGDPLYGALFKEYVSQIVHSAKPLEFFIEGTRSRTGKTLVPKMGILKFITDSFFADGQTNVADVLFVPVSLSYDELLEAKVYADELLGIPKPKENIANMLKASTQLTHKHGCIHVHFGEAISLRQVQANPFACPAPFQPKEQPASVVTDPAVMARKAAASPPSRYPSMSRTPAALLTSLAWRITYELMNHITISPSSLVAAAFESLSSSSSSSSSSNRNGGGSAAPQTAAVVAGHAVPLADIVEMVAWLTEAVRLRGGNLLASLATATAAATTTPQQPQQQHGAVDWNAITVGGLGYLTRFTRLDRPRKPTGKDSNNGASTVVLGAPMVCYHPNTIAAQLGVNITANQLVHVFVDEAVVAVMAHVHGDTIAAAAGSSRNGVLGRVIGRGALRDGALRLRRLLSVEFPNFLAESPCSFDSWLNWAISRITLAEREQQAAAACRSSLGAAAGGENDAVVVPATPLYEFLLRTLLPHTETIFLVAAAAHACLAAFCDGDGVVGMGSAWLQPHEMQQQPAVLVEHIVKATFKAGQRLHEQEVLEFIVACNEETVGRYFRALVSMKLLAVVNLPDRGVAYGLPGGSGAKGADAASASAAARSAALARLGAFVDDFQLYRHTRSATPKDDLATTKRTVLSCLQAISRGAKL